MKHILIVEDDKIVAAAIHEAIHKQGKTYQAASISEAIEISQTKSFSLAVLDRKLPDGDGLELLSYFHEESPETKILVLSDLSSLPFRLEGWRSGADDYIPKPFAREELRIRIERLFQWSRQQKQSIISYGAVSLNMDNGEGFVRDRAVRFRPKELLIFTMLMRYRGQVINRSDLTNRVWGTSHFPTNTTVDVYVRRIRMILKGSDLRITTRRGVGYRLDKVSCN